MCFFKCIKPQAGADNPLRTKIFWQQKGLFTLPMLQVSKWSLRNLILYTFFNYFIHVYSHEARTDKPLGSKFWCQQKALTTSTICCKKNLLNFDFIHIFSCFSTCIYSPGAGADNPLWTKFWCQQKGLVFLHLFCKFKKKYLWSLILYIFLPVFIHVYSPGVGADNALGSEFLF